jgi:KaiC/GvpD/RAD55 family RecA-like ATPase
MMAASSAAVTMPTLPEIDPNIDIAEEEEESDEEDKDLMTILMKLKSAKQAVENSRKRLVCIQYLNIVVDRVLHAGS